MSVVDLARLLPRALGIVLVLLFSGAGCCGAWSKTQPKRPAALAAVVDATSLFTAFPARAGTDGIQLASLEARGLPASSHGSGSAGQGPFGMSTFRAPDGLLWTKWRDVAARIDVEAGLIDDCRSDDGGCPSAAARKFLAIMRAASDPDIRTRVEAVNTRVNRAIRYVSDMQQHGVVDLWSSPLESLAAGVGDCEDYAIAKRALLLAVGVPETDMQLLLVQDTVVRQPHAVLGVRIDGRWSVLDNRNSEIIETSELPHLLPLFAIDHRGVSLFAVQGTKGLPRQSQPDTTSAAGA
ncbi:hypothetical protein TSA1_15105 [Bradyrhizobium nitroreducens]|uniref:Uncharacterized protein n=1 Tax=Bradyrhizobium nitroreducens TaxID=709803 RepID=A0A2M6UBF2_9BRAD|nr:transglutaminase-like cysteine peptidase [Bradyrhizobium nitroreducens]PIT01952.1 hypothetical protein TSA1_15105 [Bradyrhizobium nitroreducens]